MKIGIYGYGNLGKGVEISAINDKNIEIVGVFTRRAPESVKTLGTPVYSADKILDFKDTFISVYLEEGHYDIELRYMTPGLKLGGAVSAVCIALFAITMWGRKLWKRN